MRKILLLLTLLSLALPAGVLATVIEIQNPLNATSFEAIVDNLINFIFIIGIVLAPLMIIIGAFYLLTSGGDQKRVETGKKIILYAIIGLAIILFAKGLISVISGILTGGVTPPGSTLAENICNDDLDNDGDGLIDCDDPDCVRVPCPQGDPTCCQCPPNVCQDLLNLMSAAWGALCGDPKYNPIADYDKDGLIDISDVTTVGANCGNPNFCQAVWNNTTNPCP